MPVFGVVTWAALDKVQAHYHSCRLPLQPCTGAFSRTMGLPCAHIYEQRKAPGGGGFKVSDFDPHWYWERNIIQPPIQEPNSIIYNSHLSLRTQASTGRIHSTFETISQRRAPSKCTACHQTGHTRSSRICPARQTPIASSSISTGPFTVSFTSQATVTGTISAVAGITSSANFSTGIPAPVNEISSLQPSFSISTTAEQRLSLSPDSFHSVLSLRLSISVTPPPVQSLIQAAPPPPKKQLGPNRPEMVFRRYTIEKEAWLAAHPAIRPSEYRRKRGWITLRKRQLQDHIRHMPEERRNLNGDIIQAKANWSTEEVMAWLDNEERLEDEEYEKLDQQYKKDGHWGQQGGVRKIWDDIAREVEKEQEQYIL